MSVIAIYRARTAVSRLDELDAFALAEAEPDRALLRVMRQTGHPVLIGLENQPTIAKPSAEGDDALSFESLYDTCYRYTDLDRMARAGVKQPDEVPHPTFRVNILAGVRAIGELVIAMKAGDPADLLTRLRALMQNDQAFQQALAQELFAITLTRLLNEDAELQYNIQSMHDDCDAPVNPPLAADGPGWRILDPKD